jgi:cellulose synthase/poly-beta-1,6-N-acetylglucosamine synthase-like glycosyltransferase
MLFVAKIIFWCSVLALAHTYIFYPRLMQWLSRGQKLNTDCYAPDDPQLPVVSVLMSLYNEERVIAEKLSSLAAIDYPSDKLFIYIGSDCSNDQTAPLVEAFQRNIGNATLQPEQFHFQHFTQRRGKPPVINDLSRLALSRHPASPNHVLLMTDASVMLLPDTLYKLVRHFRNLKIGTVDAHMRTTGLRQEGISRSENLYLTTEVQLKHWESLAWGKMMGPFGGCYALRSDLFELVPPNSLVDDFYLVFRILERDYAVINDLEAVCYEGATHRVSDEYRRKKRIAAGSFQNLARFRRWVMPPVTQLGFAFFSHKVLRWYGGFFMFFAWSSSALLAFTNPFYQYLFIIQNLGIAAVLGINFLVSRWKIKPVWPFSIIRNVAYFLAMNVALMDGFFKWQRGIRDNSWQRTARE